VSGWSRKNHQSILAVLNKRLTNDLLHSNVARGSLPMTPKPYDRIVHSIAILSLRRWDSLWPLLVLCSRHCRSPPAMSAAFGVSTHTYGSKRIAPACRGGSREQRCPGHASGLSSALFSSCTYFQRDTVLICSRRSQRTYLPFVCYAFVDDTDLVHTSTAVSGEVVIDEMQGIPGSLGRTTTRRRGSRPEKLLVCNRLQVERFQMALPLHRRYAG
jgi:hypothetical protein